MAEQQKVKIDIGPGFTPSQRAEIAEEIIEHIRERTESGVGVRRRGAGFQEYDFPSYSESYVKSLDFKIAGKSKNKVNLTLSGDMLIAIDYLKHFSDSQSVVVGYKKSDKEENARAEGNQLGTYGKSRPRPGKKRSFLGIHRDALNEILAKYERNSGSN